MGRIKGAVVIEKDICKGCNLCVTVCPTDVLALNRSVNAKGYHYSYMKSPESCIGCGNCFDMCPDSCITVYRKKD